jgi:hypothetical protein
MPQSIRKDIPDIRIGSEIAVAQKKGSASFR